MKKRALEGSSSLFKPFLTVTEKGDKRLTIKKEKAVTPLKQKKLIFNQDTLKEVNTKDSGRETGKDGTKREFWRETGREKSRDGVKEGREGSKEGILLFSKAIMGLALSPRCEP